MGFNSAFKGLNDKLNPINPICHLLVLLGVHHILHVSRVRVNMLYVSMLTNGCIIKVACRLILSYAE